MPRVVAERGDVVPALAEVFREHGFAGASLSHIGQATGLGKSSLYHFFPGGKKEMGEAVLADIAAWFEVNVYAPLRNADDPARGIAHMFDEVDRYFRSGRRICLVGAFALDQTRDQFAAEVNGYFRDWTDALAGAFGRGGCAAEGARELAEDVVAGIQGALVLARSRDDPAVFTRQLERLRRLASAALGAG